MPLSPPPQPGLVMIPPRLSQLLARWEDAYARGQDLGPDELCPNEPELRDSLGAEIAQRRQQRARTLLSDGPPPTVAAPAEQWPATLGGAAGQAPPHARVPGYVIEGELGRGGMGVVYKARHLALNRPVALKMILHADHAGHEERLRFLAEAEAAAAVRHAGIVQVHDLGSTPDGLPYFALELCPGGSLAARLDRGPLPAADAAALVEQLAHAVQAAHDKGILHRDLKPGNILFDEAGQPKVTDFGLARRVQRDSGLTRTGAIVGTPSYMPPEQASGVTRQLGPAADIWSLGAILYECLTGRPPFAAATPVETVMQVIQHEPPPVRQLAPSCPRDLETIIHKCLQKPPARRYPRATDLADDLRRYLDGRPITARPVGRLERAAKWVRRHPVVAGLLALVVVLTAAGAGGVLLAYREAVRERDAALQANRRRLDGLIDQLLSADADAVAATLEALGREGGSVAPLLERRWPGDGLPGRERARLALALVKVGHRPDEAVPALRDRLLEADGPREVLLLRQALAPRAADVAPELWRIAEDKARPRAARFRALVALAELAPRSSRWKRAAALGADELAQANALFLATWADGLRPVRAELRDPLLAIFRGRGPAAARLAAARALGRYFADDPHRLSEMMLEADAEQLKELWPDARHRPAVAARLKAELAREAQPPEEELAAAAAPADIVREVEAALGLVQPRFALCQALPLARAEAVNDAMQKAGYRLERFRPYADGPQVQVAALWHRGDAAALLTGLTADEVRERDEVMHKAGLRPADVAGYVSGGQVRYAAVWQKGLGERRLFVGVPQARLATSSTQPLWAAGLRPMAMHAVAAGGDVLYSGAWERRSGSDYYWVYSHTEAWLEGQLGYLDYHLADVSVFATVWPLDANFSWRQQYTQANAELAKQPKKGEALYRRGQAAYRLGMYRQALADYDQAVALAPSDAARAMRAILRAWFGDAAGAGADRRAMSASSYRADLMAVIDGQIAGNLGRADEALRHLDAATPRTGAECEEVARAYSNVAAALLTRSAAGAAVAAPSPLAALTAAACAPPLPRHYATLRDRACALLERAMPGVAGPEYIATEPAYLVLRGHPRFERLLAALPTGRRYAAVRHLSGAQSGQTVYGLPPREQLGRWRELVAAGYRPVSLSVAREREGALTASSAWLRPEAREADRLELARRQGRAAALLWKLGEAEAAWPVLRHRPRPDARSYFLARLNWAEVPVEEVVARLEVEPDATARRALILALGEYGPEQVPAPLRRRVMDRLLGWYEHDADAGVHGAISWLLRYPRKATAPVQHKFDWGGGAALDRLDAALARRPWRAPAGGGAATWAVSPAGDTFTIVPRETTFVMGPHGQEARGELARGGSEVRHARRVGAFALATHNVSAAQWDEFIAANPKLRISKGSGLFVGDFVFGVTWYEAAQYCRWRSEKEGVPEREMCYPPLDVIERHKRANLALPLPPDALARAGYRMPTEAEAELVTRAGSETTYPHGDGLDLLGRYAWYGDRFQVQGMSHRGVMRPNDWGAFDLPGSPPFWCFNRARTPVPARRGDALGDHGEAAVEPGAMMAGRGSLPFAPAVTFRSAFRLGQEAGKPGLPGLRLARTWAAGGGSP